MVITIVCLAWTVNSLVIPVQNLDDAVVSIKDGHREMMDVMDANHQAAMRFGNEFESSLTGKLTIGGALVGIGITIGVGLMCCWVSCQWTDVNRHLESVAYKSARRAAQDFLANSNGPTPSTQSPPSYDVAMRSAINDASTEINADLDSTGMSINYAESELNN